MKRVFVIAVLISAAAIAVWQFPLFHVVAIDKLAVENTQASFNAAQFAETFWRERLIPSLEKSVSAEELLSSIRADPQQARRRFGRSLGISRQTLYMVQAQGTIVSVDKKSVGVALKDGGQDADIVLQMGPLFGNTVRDATGLIRPGDFPNSQHFNEISAELNRIVESQVIAPLQNEAKVDRRVHIFGCAELSNSDVELKPLSLIPLHVRFE